MNEKAPQVEAERVPDESFCSEADFAKSLSGQIRLLVYIDDLAKRNQRARFSRRILGTILEEASDLENLLDDADARYNTTFAGLFEFISSLRALSAVGYALKIVQQRMRSSGFLGEELDAEFRLEATATQNFTDAAIRDLLDRIHDEIVLICGPDVDGEPPTQMISLEPHEHRKLPHTLGNDDHDDARKMIAAKASMFLGVHKAMIQASPARRFSELEDMQNFVQDVCNEEQARFLETKIANIRSRYDTFVRNTSMERDSESLRDFRYVLEMSFQLMRVVRHLVHFYERHEDDIRSGEVKSDVTRMIDKFTVLDRVFNFALFFVYQHVEVGVPAAERLLGDFTTKETVTLELPDGCLLHARPASLIAKVVSHHGTPVEMTMGGETCYAGSIMKVILLAGNQLEERTITFSGDRKPIADLELLFEHKLGEDGLADLPDQLAYLNR